ncbi:MAG: Gfo/Idh/MocA family oxidoreductase [Planctomycetes bacterium]|nr:Gfo/Idh/MocA family oxidoreductase [Planctomycetota bacterium]
MSHRSRREFLEESMLATAAAVAAHAAPNVFADEDKPGKGPSETLGVAVMGVNGRGNSHISAFAGRGDTEILYVCDVDRDIGGKRAEEVGKRQDGHVPKFEEDIRKVLEDPRVDIVTIATPNHWHALGAIWAIQAGKDVYVEKPVSHNVSEGRRIVEAARKHKRICQTGTQSRSNPGMIAAMEYIHAGKIGEVKLARGLCYKPRGSIGPKGVYEVPANINYDLWCGPAPMGPVTRPRFHYDWHWQWDFGNGDLGNQGIHQMDLCRWALGAKTLSNAVVSYGGRFGYEDAGETANTQVAVQDYGSRSLVFEVRGLKTPRYKGASVGIIVEGTDGYVVIGSYESGVAFDKEGKEVATFKGGGDNLHFANFLKAVRSRNASDLTADIEEGHLSSALCHLANISYRLGTDLPAQELAPQLATFKQTDDYQDTLQRTLAHLNENEVKVEGLKVRMGAVLALNVAEETFQNNPAANAMLTRNYRSPYVVPGASQV